MKAELNPRLHWCQKQWVKIKEQQLAGHLQCSSTQRPPHITPLRSPVLTPQDTLPAVCLLHYRATLGFITSAKCLMMVPLMWAWIAKSKCWFVSCLSHIPVILKPTQKRRHITRGISLSSQLRSFKKFPNLNSCPSREWPSLPSNNLLRRHIKSFVNRPKMHT